LRKGSWKLVSAKLGRWELYDIQKDRTELNDVAAEHPARVQEMEAEWFQLAENVDRIGHKGLRPVGKQTTRLNFRKDTSSGAAKAGKKANGPAIKTKS